MQHAFDREREPLTNIGWSEFTIYLTMPFVGCTAGSEGFPDMGSTRFELSKAHWHTNYGGGKEERVVGEFHARAYASPKAEGEISGVVFND